MAISYVSEIIKSNPFIQPFDLNLMAKVNAYKQSSFYANANQVEDQLSNLQSADIMNPEQKNRAQQLTNNLVSQINSMSPLDYSDMNVKNTLEGFGASIYQDDQVLKGISSTKRVRELQSNIEKLKTDPKLNKYYSASNEAYALRPVEAYIKGGANATFDGDTAPTPYKGNPFTRLQDAVKKITPDVEVHFSETGNPFFIDKTTNKSVDPDKVYAAISGTVDGDMLKQIQIDSWYNMRGMSADQTLKAYNNDYTRKLSSLQGIQKFYQDKIDTEPLASVKADYQNELTDVQNRIKTLGSDYNPKEISKQLTTPEGMEQTWYSMYRNRLFDDVVKAGAYKQQDQSWFVNQQQVYNAKLELEKYKADLKANASKKKNADGTDNTAVGTVGDLGYNTENSDQAATHAVTMDTYTQRNNQYEKDISTDIYKWLDNEISLNPTYSAIFPQTTIASDNAASGPTQQVPLVLDKLRKLDANPNLSIEDIRLALNKNNPLGLNSKQIQFFQNTVNVIDKAATGQINDVDFASMKLNKGDAIKLANNVRMKQAAIESNKAYVNTVMGQVLQAVPAADRTEYANYVLNPNDARYGSLTYQYDYAEKISNPIFHGTPIGDKMRKIADDYGVTKETIEKLLNNDENRPNYFGMNLNQNGLKDKNIDLGSNIAASNNPTRPSDLGEVKEIVGTDVRRDETTGKWIMNYSYKDKKDKTQYSTSETAYQVPPALASQLGLQDVPSPELETYMRYNKTSMPFYSYNKNLAGTAGVFKYDIGRVGDSRNPEGFVIRFYDDNGNVIPIKNGYGQQPFLTANQAKTFAETVTNEQTFKDAFGNDRSNFFKTVDKIAYQ